MALFSIDRMKKICYYLEKYLIRLFSKYLQEGEVRK